MFSCWHCSRSTRLSPRACFAWALAVLSLWAVSCGQGRAVGRHSPVWRRAAGERSAPERARRSTQRNVQLRAVAWQVQTNVLLAHHSPGPARPCPGVRSIKCTSHRQITVARRRKSRARSQRDLATLKSLRVLAADSLTVGNYGITVPSSSQAASCKLQAATASKLLTTLNPCSETASLNKRKASTVHDSKRAARRYHSGQTVASCALVTIAQGTCFHPSSAQRASASPAASLPGSLSNFNASRSLTPRLYCYYKSRSLPRTAAVPLLSCNAASCHLLAQ
jgi:hypothetical protein